MPTLYQLLFLVGMVVSRFTLFANVNVTLRQRQQNCTEFYAVRQNFRHAHAVMFICICFCKTKFWFLGTDCNVKHRNFIRRVPSVFLRILPGTVR